jgi:hypothetical protein
MSKLKNYEIDAVTSKVLAMIKEENKKNERPGAFSVHFFPFRSG